jgi:hypothetical protein
LVLHFPGNSLIKNGICLDVFFCIVTNKFSAFGVLKLVKQQFIVYTLVYQVIVYILHFFLKSFSKISYDGIWKNSL